MIRVVYHWKVKEESFKSFQKAWSFTTNKIHETIPGALGSFMLRSPENKTEVITVARWDSMESWESFWGYENPEEMADMRKIGERVSVTVYEEIDDFTH
ncbi:antibiotic biosynthesis monooxygenase family protein [Halarcobacter anaerophilus]|uniref:Antibiotic biosynthesis monooxygenase n=1 Tax=Halarcobacter anaerophilus TaxID=877500 RepID=A0A4Q0Y054_9BACT|nr:antibiotic biosynthesis monooxygenase [Halarcobacter anaerophilus]QDF28668.1 antibiotic biosynthesis family monooxygenase [Halarcobacter anaerophilus]RXJ63387.1 antibiotic biosynthesis monooxygenase [Halarcobacter anaerophilus]